eukprot:403365418
MANVQKLNILDDMAKVEQKMKDIRNQIDQSQREFKMPSLRKSNSLIIQNIQINRLNSARQTVKQIMSRLQPSEETIELNLQSESIKEQQQLETQSIGVSTFDERNYELLAIESLLQENQEPTLQKRSKSSSFKQQRHQSSQQLDKPQLRRQLSKIPKVTKLNKKINLLTERLQKPIKHIRNSFISKKKSMQIVNSVPQIALQSEDLDFKRLSLPLKRKLSFRKSLLIIKKPKIENSQILEEKESDISKDSEETPIKLQIKNKSDQKQSEHSEVTQKYTIKLELKKSDPDQTTNNENTTKAPPLLLIRRNTSSTIQRQIKRTTCKIINTTSLDLLPNYQEEENTRVLIYQNDTIIHQSILAEFSKDISKELIVQRITKNQVIIDSDEAQPQTFQDEKQIENFLKKHSKSYKSIFSLQQIAQGGESIVCRLETKELEELVAKIPILKRHSQSESQSDSEDSALNYFQNSLYEHQLLKVRGNQNFTPQVKEEVIEFNKKLGVIIRYVVIIERAQNDLSKLWRIWKDQDESLSKREFYSPEKLAFYCFQSMKLINYLHSRSIYQGDIKPSNLLVYRNQLIKMGDFGISIKVDRSYWNEKKTQPNLYKPKGYTNSFALDCVQAMDRYLTKQKLFENDRFALHKTFSLIYESMVRLEPKYQSDFLKQMIADLSLASKFQTLNDVVTKYTKHFASQNTFALNLSNQMINENKQNSIREILLITNYQHVIQGLINLGSQQKQQALQSQNTERKIRSIHREIVDPGEEYNILSYHENQYGDFTYQNVFTPQSKYYAKFNQQMSWDYEEDKQDLDIQDPTWKKMAILLLTSCDDRNDECLKFQIKKRCQQIFKVGNIKLDVALEFISQMKQDSFYDKDYSDEDLRFFFDYIKANDPKPKIILQLEEIFFKLQKYDILVEIYCIQTKQLFNAQKFELAEQKAQKCIDLSKQFHKREDLEIECYLVLAFYQARRNNKSLSQKMLDICQNMIIKNYGKSSQQYLQCLNIKSLIQIDRKDYYRALEFEQERLIISKNLYGDPADETIQCYLKTGVMHLKLWSQDECIDCFEKYAKFQQTNLNGYIYLYECYHEFNQLLKLKELIINIKDNKNVNDLIYLAFLACKFISTQTKRQVLNQNEKYKVKLILLDHKERWQYLMQSMKYKTLYLGALQYCKKSFEKFNDNGQQEQILTWLNQVIDRATNDQITDKNEKIGLLEEAFEKWAKIIELKQIKTPLAIRRRSTIRVGAKIKIL